MKILVYEYVTGGGLWTVDASTSINSPLLAEATAMVQTLVADLNGIPNTTVLRLHDTRLNRFFEPHSEVLPVNSADAESQGLATWSARADGTILIAPEIDGILAARCRTVEQAGGRLLSPDSDFVRLASDKQQTANCLSLANVPTPEARLLATEERLPTAFPYPGILKPNDGVGSLHTQLVRGPQDVTTSSRPNGLARLERFCEGTPASVAALCGPETVRLLPACRQLMSFDKGLVQYVGGQLPLPAHLSQRAARLAKAALSALPATCGFVGVDLMLGTDSNGRKDVVLEVNPRLTTSYVGLRLACQTNLAAAMIKIALGDRYPLSFRSTPIRFDADGHCRRRQVENEQP